jgi:hypothetical protein
VRGQFSGSPLARSDGGGHGCALLNGLGLLDGGQCCAAIVEAGQFPLRPGQ